MKKALISSSVAILGSTLGIMPIKASYESFDTYEKTVFYEVKPYESEKYVNNTNTSFNPHDGPLLEKIAKNLIDFIIDEPYTLDEDVSYVDYFEQIRKHEFYRKIFYFIVEKGIKFRHSILNLLSYISFDETFGFEREFVFKQLSDLNVSSQEYALNTIGVWGDKDTIKQLKDFVLINNVLQERLSIIVERANK